MKRLMFSVALLSLLAGCAEMQSLPTRDFANGGCLFGEHKVPNPHGEGPEVCDSYGDSYYN